MKSYFSLGVIRLTLIAALFFVLSGNQQFWSQCLAFFTPLQGHNLLLIGSLFSVTFCLMLFLLNLIAIPRLLRPLLTLILFGHAAAAYFMNGYGISIDRDMLQNVFETNPAEAFELVNLKLIAYLLVLGALPFWERLRGHTRTQAALAGTNAAVVGLLLAALYQPVWTNAIHTPPDFGLALVAWVALMFWKWPPWLVVLGSAVGGAVLAHAL